MSATSTSDRPRSILHVDMDAFFASVELLDQPELRGRPVVVGGSGARGVVAAASYEARWYGIHSAMPGAVARRACPHAVFLDGRHGRYREVSAQIMTILGSFTPFVEPLSLDEAFLDVSGVRRAVGPPAEIARRIRAEVLTQVGLTCSVGVAPNKFLAKLATNSAKPRATVDGPVFGTGVCEIDAEQIEAFLWPLPVEVIWGVGPATLAKLQRLGVHTVGELARVPIAALTAALGRSSGQHLAQLAHGIDDREVVVDAAPKSVSHEETFATDRIDRDGLERELVRMSDAVAARLRTGGIVARTVQLKVRFAGFETITRARTLPVATDDGWILLETARQLFDAVDIGPGVRLIGVGVSALAVPGPSQLTLDLVGPDQGHSGGSVGDRARVNDAIDEIRDRFGRTAIGPATLVEAGGGVGVFVEGQQQWGPSDSTRRR